MESSNASAEFYRADTERFKQRWKIVLKKKTLWKRNIKFVKTLPTIYVNFIVIEIIASEKKGALTVVLTFSRYSD